MKKLLIGKMAKICNVSIQTLRYYDNINLIGPSFRDPESNYRYYDISQVFRINIIKYLQYSGLSIEEIRRAMTLNNQDLLNFWQEQETQIDQRIKELKQTKLLAIGQQFELQDLLDIQKYPQEKVYQRQISEQTIVGVEPEYEITPLDHPDEATGKLDQLLIDNGTIGNLQYGFAFPMKDYQQLSDIKYDLILTRVFTDQLGTASKYLSELPAGRYLCINFNWTREKYFEYYLKLKNTYQQEFGKLPAEVYEISSVDKYQYAGENSFNTELRVKI